MRNPRDICANTGPEVRPTRSTRNSRSIVMIWETLATESFGSPTSSARKRTLPGASLKRTFEVRMIANTVRIRLRLNESAWDDQ